VYEKCLILSAWCYISNLQRCQIYDLGDLFIKDITDMATLKNVGQVQLQWSICYQDLSIWVCGVVVKWLGDMCLIPQSDIHQWLFKRGSYPYSHNLLLPKCCICKPVAHDNSQKGQFWSGAKTEIKVLDHSFVKGCMLERDQSWSMNNMVISCSVIRFKLSFYMYLLIIIIIIPQLNVIMILITWLWSFVLCKNQAYKRFY